jgi:eukaryotic-like serine/threonine-protein kinase
MKSLSSIFIFVLYSRLMFSQTLDWPVYRGTPDLTGYSEWKLPENPKVLWSFNSGSRTKSSPVISDGLIYFGTDKGIIYACDLTGKVAWKLDAGSSTDAPPLIAGQKIIFSTSDGRLMAADKKTGKLLWTYKTDNQIVGSANMWKAGTKYGIVVGSYDFNLHCVEPDSGNLLWKVETNNYINGTPAISGSRIVFGGCDGIVRVVDPNAGKEKDSIQIGVYIAGSPSLFDSRAFFGDYEGNFYCLNLVSRKYDWKKISDGETSSIIAAPAIGKGVVIIGDENKIVICYNLTDGAVKWKFRTNGSIKGSSVISGNEVLVASMDRNVYILGLSDGSKKWSYNTGGSVSASPAVTKDCFFILTEDGRLIAFGK